MKLHRKHTQSKRCYDCENFDRTRYEDKYPKKCKCGGFIHHEVDCRGWDRCSFGWSSHVIKCDKCGRGVSFSVDFEDESFEKQYYDAIGWYNKKRITKKRRIKYKEAKVTLNNKYFRFTCNDEGKPLKTNEELLNKLKIYIIERLEVNNLDDFLNKIVTFKEWSKEKKETEIINMKW